MYKKLMMIVVKNMMKKKRKKKHVKLLPKDLGKKMKKLPYKRVKLKDLAG